MATISTCNLESGLTYDFVMCAPAILGARYDSARLLATGMLYDAAKLIQNDLAAKHTAALPSLKTGVPRSVNDLTYLLIQTVSGVNLVIAQEWLATNPVLVITKNISVSVYNVKPSDQMKIRDLLVSAGYPSIDISTI